MAIFQVTFWVTNDVEDGFYEDVDLEVVNVIVHGYFSNNGIDDFDILNTEEVSTIVYNYSFIVRKQKEGITEYHNSQIQLLLRAILLCFDL